jgi:hypothetical protein
MGKVVMRRRGFKREIVRSPACRDWQREAARLGQAAIREAAPKDTGLLIARIDAEARPDGSVRFRAGVGSPPYGLFQEVGTGLYGPLRRWITPKRAKALSWIESPQGTRFFGQSNQQIMGQGRRVFAARVRGSKPKRYFRQGLWNVFGRSRVKYYGTTGGIGRRLG